MMFTAMFMLLGNAPNYTRWMYITKGDRSRKFQVSRARGMSFLGACYHRQQKGWGTMEFHFAPGGWLYTQSEPTPRREGQ